MPLDTEWGESDCSKMRARAEGGREDFTEGVPFVLEASVPEVGRRNGNNILVETRAQRSVSV